MVGEIAAQHPLPQEVVERVSERTGGVPLFVEEVTRLLVERGDTGSQGVPPTLQQSLAARLDRLGEAREVAQIGAVLGRDFAFELLRDVAGLDESALRPALERLTKVDLLFVEGVPPQANYRFKHALIQDAAYDSLLKSRRQALHRRAAELLRDNPDRATAEPEVIAHHFAQGGLDDLAVEWWGKAGDQRWHQTLKSRILLEHYYLPGNLDRQVAAFVAHYNHARYHESLDNHSPADVHFGRAEAVLLERERIKRQTIANRRLQHQLHAA